MDMGKVTIYTQAWGQDAPVRPGERDEQVGTIHLRVAVDGVEVPRVFRAMPRYDGKDFTTVTLEVAPASVEIVECDEEQWRDLDNIINRRETPDGG